MNDREILRELAKKVYDISISDTMQAKKQKWIKQNKLEGDDILLLCMPEGSWCEVITDDMLTCTEPKNRKIEWNLRSRLFLESLGDDNVITNTYPIGWHTQYSNYGVKVVNHYGSNRGSRVWEAPIKDLEEDFHKLKHRTFTVDKQSTFDEVAYVNDMIGDILDVKIRRSMCWTFGLTADAIDLLGLENFMFAMYDYPEKLHELMAFLKEDYENLMNFYTSEGLHTLLSDGETIGSGAYGFTDLLPQSDFTGTVRTKDIWGFAESQETVGVSADMFGEFIFPYQKELLSHFGLNCYGCCEPIEKRWKYLKEIPNLRRLSVSPWSDNELAAEVLGKNYVFSKKPNPSPVCVGFDEKAIRSDIRSTLRAAKNCNLEMVLKDTHTVEHRPERFKRWVEIAREEIASM